MKVKYTCLYADSSGESHFKSERGGEITQLMSHRKWQAFQNSVRFGQIS